MYVPDPFAEHDRGKQLGFIARHPFATLTTARGGAVGISHIPMYLVSDAGRDFLVGHLARANDHWKTIAGPGTAVFHGPQAYVSSAWYQARNTVPTWNYAVVHVHGLISLTGPEELRGIIARMLAIHEGSPDGPPGHMDEAALAALMAHIVGIKLDIASIEGKWKLSQNKSTEIQAQVADALERGGAKTAAALDRQGEAKMLSGDGLAEANSKAVAKMMRDNLRARPLEGRP